MGFKKLSAGDGYVYLTRQVAILDGTDLGRSSHHDYYSEKGEIPGVWRGRGLFGVGLAPGSSVTEQQMLNLFGEGRHPDAQRIEDEAHAAGLSQAKAIKASRLGRVFPVYRGPEPEFIQRVARARVDWNLEHGQHWNTALDPEVKAEIATNIAEAMFIEQHGRAPLDDRERHGFIARISRKEYAPTAGFDLTFTPVKSVSVAWALADDDVKAQIEEAQDAAVNYAMDYLETEMLVTRRGRGGVQQHRAVGVIAAVFRHRDSRAGDPNLHDHVAIANKVQDASGAWLAIDARTLYAAKVTLTELYNTRLETELIARLGVCFEDRRPRGRASGEKRPVRELVGIDERISVAWSKRRRVIEQREVELAEAFQVKHGRPPRAAEANALFQQATLETREAKHEPRSEADQRQSWLDEAIAIVGGHDAVNAMLGDTLGRDVEVVEVTPTLIHDAADAVMDRVEGDRSAWTRWNVCAEAYRQARYRSVGSADLDHAVNSIVSVCLEERCVAFAGTNPELDPATASVPLPAETLREDPDGPRSVYLQYGAQLYTSQRMLDAEDRLLSAARLDGGRAISPARVGLALVESAANGKTLNDAQQAMVRDMATSGRRLQLALAPAGTGKTTAMEVLTRAWVDSGGTILGIAPSARAEAELGVSIKPDETSSFATTGVHTDVLDKLTWHIKNGDHPDWMRRIDHRTLVLLDEAGMAGTLLLDTAVQWLLDRGASVRLIGDTSQLASVKAGGVLRDIADEVGALTLTEVRRFLHEDGSINVTEGAATLAVRRGDPAAIAFYTDRGRVHVGDLGSCAAQAYDAWAADTAKGHNALLLAPTRELVARLNTRAREDRIRLLGTPVGPVVHLADGTMASAGDTITTRDNNRRLRINRHDYVRNGYRWTVDEVLPGGALRVTREDRRAHCILPADYVTTHVTLGYASTVHGAQGATVDTCHVVLTGEEDRNLLYVGASRGRYSNHLYLGVAHAGDPHNLIDLDTLIPPTAVDTLTKMLARDGTPISARTAQRNETDPVTLLRASADVYLDLVTDGSVKVLGEEVMARIDAVADAHDLTDAPAWPTLRSHLALLALNDHDPIALLTAAVRQGSLEGARDVAAVVDARIDHALAEAGIGGPVGPLPWLPGIPAKLARTDWGRYAAAFDTQVRERTATVTDLAAAWTGTTAPAWALPFIDPEDATLRGQIAVWRAVHGTDDADLRPTGERTIGAPGDYQRRLERAAQAARPSYPFAQRSWYQALPESVRTDPWLIPLCQQLTRLERAGLPVSDYITTALDPAGDGAQPLPVEQPAAALWWRLTAHLGPAALAGDQHMTDLLQPDWRPVLDDLVGEPKAAFLQHSPAWPALVAAVDEAVRHHGWTPEAILSAGLSGIPQDGTLTGVEVADALVLRIAMLTDPPRGLDPRRDGAHLAVYDPDAPWPWEDDVDPELLPPEDLYDVLDDIYRDEDSQPADAHLTPDEAADPEPAWLWRSKHDVQRELAEAEFARAEKDPYYEVPAWAYEYDQRDIPPVWADPDALPRERILELNHAAMEFYAGHYERSWAPAYLRNRLGTDLVNHDVFTPGYAPGSSTALLRHLTAQGATVAELEQAGLVRVRDRRDGSVDYIDFFRDRLILPIRDPRAPAAILGFQGRRNPTKEGDFAGPKYLNTRSTPAFTKGDVLFGFAESAAALAGGALPVIVEGPMDALAITLASDGEAVGLAPMGTALTVAQIKLLLPTIDRVAGRDRIVVATDADVAGWKAAQGDYWNLTAAGLDPAYVVLPEGTDPGALLQAHGPDAVIAAIRARVPLADVMLEHVLRTGGEWTTSEGRQNIVTQAARIFAARTDHWYEGVTHVNQRLHLADGFLVHRLLEVSDEREADLAAWTRQRLEELQDQSRAAARTAPPETRSVLAPDPTAPDAPAPSSTPATPDAPGQSR